MTSDPEDGTSEFFLDKAIKERREREVSEAWSALTNKEMSEGTREQIDAILKIVLTETIDIPTSDWWYKYLSHIEDIQANYGMPEAAALWLLIRAVAVYAGTTGFKRGIAALSEAEELTKGRKKSI